MLVVDDNETNRALAQSTLEDEGYTVVLAAGGRAGIEAFEKHAPDCILLDVKMPDLDGFSVCTSIRELPGGSDVPILFFTALRDVDTFDRAVAAGGSDFLTKPVRPTELIVRVQSALKLRRMSVELREHFELMKQQRDDLMRLHLQKERLMAFIVHDLKNPVNSMDLHAQLLARDKRLPEEARESAMHIRVEARHLHRMILNLLDLSKADEGQLNPRRTDVAIKPLLDDVFSELTINASARNITLEAKIEAVLTHADEDLLRRTLTNLIENALRYAPEKSAVKVVARAVSTGVEFRVADAGKGIPADLREHVFSPFVQLESREQPTRSSRGLGLTFCKLAVEAHGGDIWIEDAAPGAIFCVRIPPKTV
ncbi:MAG: hybrid sensor histidine kinase/response regulator [Polyangiaceae bacterium]